MAAGDMLSFPAGVGNAPENDLNPSPLRLAYRLRRLELLVSSIRQIFEVYGNG